MFSLSLIWNSNFEWEFEFELDFYNNWIVYDILLLLVQKSLQDSFNSKGFLLKHRYQVGVLRLYHLLCLNF